MSAELTQPKSKRRSDNPDPVDEYVGKRLRERRNLLGMSQEQLGKATGLTFQQIQKYERGANRMGASRLYQIGQVLNVPPAYFYENMPVTGQVKNIGFSDSQQASLEGAPGKAMESDSDILQRRDVKELIRAYNRISNPKQRRVIYDLAKSMMDKNDEKLS